MKNIFKKTRIAALILALIIAVMAFSSCADTPAGTDTGDGTESTSADTGTSVTEKEPVRVYTLMGPTGMGMAKLISDDKEGASKLDYDFTIASAPDQITSEVIKGNFDIAAVPVNLASVLYKKTGGAVKVAGVNTLGVLYVLENGDTVNSVGDLKGKTIYVTGQGSTPEYVLNYILTKNGIDPEKDITIEFLAEHAELAAQMTSGSVSLGLLPQPNVTSVLMNNSDVRIALDFTEEWRKVSDSDLVMGCIIVSKEFAEEHSDELETFLEEYGKSVEFVNSDADGASKLIEEAGIVPKAAIAKNALPYCNIVLNTGETMRSQMNGMLGVLYEANPASVGGSLPDEAFFYMVK